MNFTENFKQKILKTYPYLEESKNSSDCIAFFQNKIINEIILKNPDINLNKNKYKIYSLAKKLAFENNLMNLDEIYLIENLNINFYIHHYLSVNNLGKHLDEDSILLLYKKLLKKKKYLKKIEILNLIFLKNDSINYSLIPYSLEYKNGFATFKGLKIFKAKTPQDIKNFLRIIIKIVFFKFKNNYTEKDDSFLFKFPLDIIDTISIRKEYQSLKFINEIKLFKSRINLENISDIYKYLSFHSFNHNFYEVCEIYKWCFENLPEYSSQKQNLYLKKKYILLSTIIRILKDFDYFNEKEIKQYSKKIYTIFFSITNEKEIDFFKNFYKIVSLIAFIFSDYTFEELELYLESLSIKNKKIFLTYLRDDLKKVLRYAFNNKISEYNFPITIVNNSNEDFTKNIFSHINKHCEKINDSTINTFIFELKKFCFEAISQLKTIPIKTNNTFIDGFFIYNKTWVYIENNLLSKNMHIFDDIVKKLVLKSDSRDFESSLKNALKNTNTRDKRYKLKIRILNFYKKMLLDKADLQSNSISKHNNHLNERINLIKNLKKD